MSHLGRKQELDTSYDKIMHSTPKYGRDSYDSRVSSHLPGELRISGDNDLSNVTEQVSRKEKVTVRSGASRSVSQQDASSNDSSTRALELTSDGRRNELLSDRSMRAIGDPRSSDISTSRTSGDSLLDGDKLGGDSSRSILMESSTSRYNSEATNNDKYGGPKSSDHSSTAVSKTAEHGFQYEDIQSFRDRQQIEGDRLQLHRRRLSGNIVGTVKKGDLAGGITSPDSGYSSGIAADLEKSGDGEVHHYTSSVREYKSYGTSHDHRLARDKVLGDDKSGGIRGSHVQSSITSHDYKSSRDGGSSSDDRSARDRALGDSKSGVSGSHIHSSTTSHDYKSSKDGGSSSDDRLARDRILGDSKSGVSGSHLHSSTTSHEYRSSRDGGTSRDKYLADPKSGGITDTSHLRSSITSGDNRDLLNDRFSRERMLADARGKTTETSIHTHSSSSNADDKISRDRNISGVASRLSGDVKSGSTDASTHLHTRSSDYKTSSSTDTAAPRDDKFSKTDALVAKYLDSSRYKSKRASDIDVEHKHLSSLTEIKEEDKEIGRRREDRDVTREKHHSVSGKPMSYLPKDSSYKDLLKKKKEDSSYSSKTSSVLDKSREIPSHSKSSYGDVTSKTDRRSDLKDSNVPGSHAGKDGKDDMPRRMSYDWQDTKGSREQAIDRLLDTTRRYSVDSILDKTSHDKKFDDVIGAMTNKDLGSSTSHVERHVRETAFGGGPDISRHSHAGDGDISRESVVSQHRLSSKTSSESELDTKLPSDVDSDRIRLRDNEKAKAMSPDDRLKYLHKETQRTRYQTPYTSLDHSHFKPTSFGENVDDDRIYAVPIKKSAREIQPDSHYPEVNDNRGGDISDRTRPEYPPAYKPSSTSHKPEEVIYDKLRRGSGPLEKPKTETRSSGLDISKHDNRRDSIEGLDEPVYERLNLTSGQEPHPAKGIDSPVPMSDHFGLPLDKYDKPVALHGKTKEPANREEMLYGREIVSKYPERQLVERPRGGDLSDFMADEHTNVRETTRTSVMQRSFVSRNGEVIKDEVKRHDEIRHGGQDAIEGIEGKYSTPEMPTRIQRYPAVKREEKGKDVSDSRKIEDVRRLRDPKEPKCTDKTKGVTPNDHNLDEVMKLTGLDSTGDVTNYQQSTRRDDVTRIQDDSNFRTKVHRTDVNTNVNIVKEISAPKRDKPKSGRLGIADLKSKIEALTKSVDELNDLKRKTVLRSYMKEHAERRSSKDMLESLPKIERYEVKSKRYVPKEIELDQVDYVYKKLELEELPKRPERIDVELNIQSLWLSEEQQKGKDIGLHIPRQINLAPENTTVEWWNAATAEDADRFLCIGDWKWWNANTTEGVDHILGVQAIDRETGATGAIIAKYQGEEQPVQWAWIEAANQPTANEKRRTLTRVLKIDHDSEDSKMWDRETTNDGADQHLGIGNLQWWNANTTESVEQLLGVRGTNKETTTILATYDEGTKPTAWTWVQTTQKAPEVSMEKNHSLTRSSRDIYVDETDNGKVELLIRVQDEETQDPRFIAIRPGPVEKAIIVHQAVESELPYTRNLWAEGKKGGLQVKNGVVQMKVQDLTPQEREAWVHIMGMEDRNFKLQEHETFEIPVKFVDQNRRVEKKEDLYAVPIKKNKRKPQSSTKSVKSTQVEEKKKLEEKKSVGFEKKKKEKKETDSEKKKRESKIKKLEAEKKKKEELEKKKKEEMEKRKKEEKTKLEKKRESKRIKEKEIEKKSKEQQKKKVVGSVKKEKVDVVKGQRPPPVDRSTKPQSMRIKEVHAQDTRRHSDVVDAGMGQRREQFERGNSKRLSHVEVSTRNYGSVPSSLVNKSSKSVTKVHGGSFSPKKTGPFAMTGKGVTPRAQSARAKMTSHVQSQNTKTVIEERGGNLTRKASPSVKVVKRVSVTQSGNTRPYSPDQTDAIKHKSGSLQRRSGSSIAVPLRGGASKPTNGSVKVISNQTVQSQMLPGQNTRQTTVHESHSYRTETHVTSNDGRSNAVLPQIAAGNVGPGHSFGKENIEAGHVGVERFGGGQGHVGASHVKVDQGVIGHAGAGNIGLQNVGAGHVGVENVGRGHVGVQYVDGGHIGVQHVDGGHVGVQHVGGGHVGVQHVGGSHAGVQHVDGGHIGVQHVGGGHVGVQHVGGSHAGVQHVDGGQIGAGQIGVYHFRGGHVGPGHVGPGHAGVEHVGGGQGHVGAGHFGSVVLHNMPTESSTDYSHESGVHQLPDGSYVQRDVSHVRRTSWAVEGVPTKGQTKC